MVRKGKRASIRDKELQIAEFVAGNPYMGRTALAEKMVAEIKWGGKAPEVEVLERKVSKYRNPENPDPLNEPWTMSVLKDHPIPSEAVPVVLKAWAKALLEDKPLTIRQAEWIGRLHHAFEGKDIGALLDYARGYANHERATRLVVLPSGKAEDIRGLWFRDAILYVAMTRDDAPLLKCMKMYKNWRTVSGPEALEYLRGISEKEKGAKNER